MNELPISVLRIAQVPSVSASSIQELNINLYQGRDTWHFLFLIFLIAWPRSNSIGGSPPINPSPRGEKKREAFYRGRVEFRVEFQNKWTHRRKVRYSYPISRSYGVRPHGQLLTPARATCSCQGCLSDEFIIYSSWHLLRLRSLHWLLNLSI